MAIKRIQLRGISRAPSDRMTEDGGVAESLNARLEDTEIAPISKPRDCNEDFGLDKEPLGYEPIFVHKTDAYEHVISYDSTTGSLLYLDEGILQMEGYLKDVVSLGNTLVVTSTEALYYLLFIDGAYKAVDLSEDSLPKLSFVNINQESGPKGGATYDIWSHDSYIVTYTHYPNGDKDNNYLVTDEDDLVITAKIWDTYRSMIDNNLALGCFSQPVMLRYGIRLYDNSYLWASSPIMLGSCLPKENDPSMAFGSLGDRISPVVAYSGYSISASKHRMFVQLSCPYKIGVNAYRTQRLSELKDVVSSIDIFVSAPIEFAPEGHNRVRGEHVARVEAGDYNSCYRYFFDPVNSENPKKREEAVLAASNFFLVKSYQIDELPEGTDVLTDDFRGENLFVKTRFDDGKVTTILGGAEKVGVYNERLLATGISEYFSRGIGVLNGQCANAFEVNEDIDVSGITYAFAYHIPNHSLVIKDYSAKDGGKHLPMTPDMGKAQLDRNDINDVLSTPYAWISHPNPNCTKVTIKTYSEGYEYGQYDIDMKPHPFLSCSYAFLGIGERIFKDIGVIEGEDFDSFSDVPMLSRGTVAAFSSTENPFAFQTAAKIAFGSKIKGFAMATEPMSTGQFGQFPLYFFLEDGIWAVKIADDGNFGSQPSLVSRDVCVNSGSITPTKDAIFFMSERGLLYVSGRETTSISDHMLGKAYSVPEHLNPLIECANYPELISEDPVVGFYDFMWDADTKIAYDYVGQRLICFNSAYDWQYVYSVSARSWHRAQYGKINSVLNAYPRCVVTVRSSHRSGSIFVTKYALSDLSLSYKQDADTKKMMVATRPFDLDEPDVLKTIKDVRVRGQFAKGTVKFILQGSLDGINFYTISTLRGKSWKLFRLIILADLEATDRISWVDIVYETRFTNRLR